MLNLIIIDDEPDARQLLRGMLNQQPDCRIIAEAGSFADATILLKNTKPDVVFLDIDLRDGTGFEVLESLPSFSFSVIFATAFDTFALKAFQANALDYILKPVVFDDVKRALDKVRRLQPTGSFQQQVAELLGAMRQKKVEKLVLQTAEGVYFVPLDEVLHLESDGSYTTVHTTNGGKILVSKHLGEFEYLHTSSPTSGLYEYGDFFFRTHQSHIVNLKGVRQFLRSTEGNYALLSNGRNVPISRRCKEEFLAALKTC
jgi:two-component system, LytTR family, response regulator